MISGDFIKRTERKDLRGGDNKRATYCHMQCGSVQLSSVQFQLRVRFRFGSVRLIGMGRHPKDFCGASRAAAQTSS